MGLGLRDSHIVTRAMWGREVHSDQTPCLQEWESTGYLHKLRATKRRQLAAGYLSFLCIIDASGFSPLHFIYNQEWLLRVLAAIGSKENIRQRQAHSTPLFACDILAHLLTLLRRRPPRRIAIDLGYPNDQGPQITPLVFFPLLQSFIIAMLNE